MSRLQRSNRLLPLLLTAICIGLALLTYHGIEALGTLHEPASSDALVAVSDEPLPGELELSSPPREALSVIVERPIFSQSRRPAPKPLDKPSQGAALKLDFELAGIVIWRSERFALMRLKQGTGFVQVGEGGNVSGWEVIGIQADRVLVRKSGLEQELQLKYKEPQGGS